MPAVAHDRDPLAEREHLLEPVRDEEHGGAARAQRLGDAEQPLDLGGRERRRRLVHHDHARVRRQRLHDLDQLLVGDREPARQAVGIDAHAELLEERGRVAAHLAPVDPMPALERLRADEDVLRDAEVGEERRLLEDDRDPRLLRLLGAVEDHLLAVEQQPAALGPVDAGEDLHERRLAGAVLAHERVRLAGVQLDVRVLERADGAEGLVGVLEHEHRLGRGGHAQSRWKISSSSSRPSSGRRPSRPTKNSRHLCLPACVHLGLLHRRASMRRNPRTRRSR